MMRVNHVRIVRDEIRPVSLVTQVREVTLAYGKLHDRETSLRPVSMRFYEKMPVVTPSVAALLFRQTIIPETEMREVFGVAMLNTKRHPFAVSVISIGTMNASLMHPRELFGPALVAKASGLVLAHNHPSGDVNPSPEDEELTVRMVRAGNLLGVPICDNVILGLEGDFFSFRERRSEIFNSA